MRRATFERVKIAVASSGLGHVARGIETWARDTAVALAAQGAEVTLFAQEQFEAQRSELGASCPVILLPSLRRGDDRAVRLSRRSPGWSWRWQLKDPYGWEQLSFWRHLWPHLRRARFDILHVQDPMLAWWCRLFRRTSLLRTKEILAHGTEETPGFLAKFDYVQHLAPWHLEQAGGGRLWMAIPNFVDTAVFRPRRPDGAKDGLRARLGIPEEAFVVGTVAAVKKGHKRVDYLIREFASSASSSFLLIAGAKTEDSDGLVRLAEELAPKRVRFLFDRPRSEMPEVYRAMDLFVLASLFEMMPIALLEALASGLPVAVNRHPVLEWMAGLSGDPACRGGVALEMGREGGLCAFLESVTPAWLAECGACARRQAERNFAVPVVIGQYLDLYRQVVELPA